MHWERTGIVDITMADNLTDGSRFSLHWVATIAPESSREIRALEAGAPPEEASPARPNRMIARQSDADAAFPGILIWSRVLKTARN